MTSELEKTFFDTFGIEAYYKYLLIDKTRRYNNEKLFDKTNFIDFIKSGKDYLLLKVIKYPPKITDHILLELICICNNTYINGYTNYFTSCGKTVEEIKKEILKKCIFLQDDIKQQVQELFEKEN